MSTTNELILSIPECSLSHLLDGNILPLGNGTLELKLVSTPPPGDSATNSSPLPSSSTTGSLSSAPHLVLSLIQGEGTTKPIYELSITTSSVLLAQPPHAYLVGIPKSFPMTGTTTQEVEEDEQGFVRIVLPSTINPETRESFEAILWSHAASESDMRGKLVLVDQESGEVIGELASDVEIPANPDTAEDEKLTTADDETAGAGVAVVDFEDGKMSVSVKSRTWSEWKPTVNPTGSRIITMGDYVSRGIVAGADAIGMGLEKGGRKVVSSSRATQSPMIFSNSTRRNVKATNDLASGARMMSGKALSVIGGLASKAGGAIGQSLGIQQSANGAIPTGIKGVVHKSLIAINTVAESIETGGKVLLDASSSSATSVVQHRYGSEAAEISRSLGSSVKRMSMFYVYPLNIANQIPYKSDVVLVYVDAQGVTRNALLKSAGKGAIRAKMADGREVILSEGSGSVLEKPTGVQVGGEEKVTEKESNIVSSGGKHKAD